MNIFERIASIAKAIVAAATAASGAFVAANADGVVSANEWFTVAIAAAAALGAVWVVPNKTATQTGEA